MHAAFCPVQRFDNKAEHNSHYISEYTSPKRQKSTRTKCMFSAKRTLKLTCRANAAFSKPGGLTANHRLMLNPEQSHIKTMENCWTKQKKNICVFVFPYSNSAVACRVFTATYNIHAAVALVLHSVCCSYCFLCLFCWCPASESDMKISERCAARAVFQPLISASAHSAEMLRNETLNSCQSLTSDSLGTPGRRCVIIRRITDRIHHAPRFIL